MSTEKFIDTVTSAGFACGMAKDANGTYFYLQSATDTSLVYKFHKVSGWTTKKVAEWAVVND